MPRYKAVDADADASADASFGEAAKAPRDFLPRLCDIAAEFAKDDLPGFEATVPVADLDEYVFHSEVRARLFKIARVALREATGRSYLEKTKLVVQGVWRKGDLIRTLESAEHMLHVTYVVPGIHAYIRRELHSVEDQYRLEKDDESQSLVSAKVKLLYTLILMMLVAMPAAKIENIGWRPETKLQIRSLLWALSRPLPESDRFAVEARDQYSFVRTDQEEAMSRDMGGWRFPLGQGWFDTSSPLGGFGREFAHMVGLRDLQQHSQDAQAKRLIVLEEQVLIYYQGFLSSVVANLKSAIESVDAMRTKMVAVLGTCAMSAATFLINTYLFNGLRANTYHPHEVFKHFGNVTAHQVQEIRHWMYT